MRFLISAFAGTAISLSAVSLGHGAETALFDQPTKAEEVALPPVPDNPSLERKVTCLRYNDFMVKQVDWGEVGSQKITLLPVDAPCVEQGTGEKVFKDLYGYFLGRKVNYLFFRAGDGLNGGMPFYVYDPKTLNLLFQDNFEDDGFSKLEILGNGLTLEYRRVYAAKCSLFIGGAKCADQIKAEINEMGNLIPMPDCDAAYRAEMKRTPEFAEKVAALPSVISYMAKLHFDGRKLDFEALEGETYCNPPS